MAQCPFCSAEVPVRLVVEGGTCPSCFGEIPGEDSPTDPGEAVREQLRQEDQRRARRRAMLPVFVATPVALVSLLVAGWYLQPVEIKPLEIPDLAIELDLQDYVPPAQVAQQGKVPAKVKGPGETPSTPDGRSVAGELHGTPPAGPGGLPMPAIPQTAGYTPDGRRVVADPSNPLPTDRDLEARPDGGGSTGSVDFGDLTPKLEREAPVLVNDADISRAVKDMVRARRARLQQCYEQSLKVDESLAGQWKVSFVIGTDGHLRDVAVKASGRSAPAFEGCIRDQMNQWSIRGQLEKERSLALPFTFGPTE